MRRALVPGLLLLAVAAGGLAAGWWIRGPSQALSTAAPSASGPASDVPATDPGATPAASLVSVRLGLPNPRLTPGAINPNVRSDSIGTTICKVGWTSTIRPPSAYTAALKLAQIVEYGYADRNPGHYQEDHLVPLELGGAPRDPRNLWPEPESVTLPDGTVIEASEKDSLEDELRRRVCTGTMDLGDAQRLIAGDWFAAWRQLGEP